MLYLKNTDYPDFNQYEKNLTRDCKIYFDYEKLRKKIALVGAKFDALEYLLRQFLFLNTYGEFQLVNPTNIKKYLRDYTDIPDYMLKCRSQYTGATEYSLDLKRVIQPIYDKGYEPEFLSLYIEYVEAKSALSNMRNNMKHMQIYEPQPSIRYLTYKVKRMSTGRFYTSDANIQGISKAFTDCIVAPDGYFLLWGDLDQADLRIVWELYLNQGGKHDKMFRQYPDRYEAIARIVDDTMDKEFREDEFKEDRNRYKVSILARAYNATKNTLLRAVNDKDFIDDLDAYFYRNKRYMSYVNLIESAKKKGDTIRLMDYFGVVREVPSKGKAVKSVCLNTPPQSTTNSIMMNYVNKVVDGYAEEGFNSDDIRVYMLRHDEPVWILSNRMKSYLHLLKSYQTIQVDDWNEITMKIEGGTYYSIAEEDIKKELENTVVSPQPEPEIRHVYYSPICEESDYYLVQKERRVMLFSKSDLYKRRMFTIEGDLHFGIKRAMEDYANVNMVAQMNIDVLRCDFNLLGVIDREHKINYNNHPDVSKGVRDTCYVAFKEVFGLDVEGRKEEQIQEEREEREEREFTVGRVGERSHVEGIKENPTSGMVDLGEELFACKVEGGYTLHNKEGQRVSEWIFTTVDKVKDGTAVGVTKAGDNLLVYKDGKICRTLTTGEYKRYYLGDGVK